MGEFSVLGGSPIGEIDDHAAARYQHRDDARWDPSGGPDDVSPSGTIAISKPLFVRIHRIFTGQERHGEALVSSAVRAETDFAAAPRALHFIARDVKPQTFLSPLAGEDGTPIVYYTPANLDRTLSLEFRCSFDDFDRRRYERIVDLIHNASQLPVFALSSVFAGPLSGAAGTTIVAAVANAVKVGLGALDRRVDGNNDWVASYDLHIDTPGLERAQAGWVLLRANDEGSTVMVRDSDAPRYTSYTQLVDSDAFYVSSQDGELHYSDGGEVVNDLDQPYVLLHISGVSDDKWKAWKATQVSAQLLERFFSTTSDAIDDIGELMSIFNDVMMARRVGAVDSKLRRASEEERGKLTEQRRALLEHIQDKDLKGLLDPVEGNAD